MKLIEFDGTSFKAADEAFLIRPIRELFLADKSRAKEGFWRQMSYLWFMCDPRSTYMYMVDEKERSAEIIAQEGLGEGWEPSAKLKEAMDIYRSHTVTTSSLLLEGMRKGIDNLRRFLETMDLSERDRNGKPVYQVSTMTAALKQVPDLSKALAEAERALAKDFESTDRAVGSTEKAAGEDW